jgi:formate/nitrite transporter FocA (FNT family)
VKNWTWSYLGNLVGSLLMVVLVAATGLLAASPVPANMAVAKTAIPFTQVGPWRGR